jgi:hypothetical protein
MSSMSHVVLPFCIGVFATYFHLHLFRAFSSPSGEARKRGFLRREHQLDQFHSIDIERGEQTATLDI